VGGDALQLEVRQGADQPREVLDRVDVGVRKAAAVEAAVHLDLDVDLHARCSGRLRQAADALGAVDVDSHLGLARQPCDPRPFLAADHRVGDDHIPDARRHERLRLADLGAGDTGGPQLLLLEGDLGDLVGLDVGAQFRPRARDRLLPLAEIALHAVQVDDQRRRVERLYRGTDLDHRRLHFKHGKDPSVLLLKFVGESPPGASRSRKRASNGARGPAGP